MQTAEIDNWKGARRRMRCENCGAQIEDEVLTVYCKACGQRLHNKALQPDEEAGGQQTGDIPKKQGGKRRVWYFAAGCGVVLLAGIVILLVVMQGPGAFRSTGERRSSGSAGEESVRDDIGKLYGEWSDENGLLSMTFQEDGTVRIGAGAGFFGADLFTFTEEGGDTLYLKANAEGLLGAVSLQLDYELEEDTMAISFLGMNYVLKRK